MASHSHANSQPLASGRPNSEITNAEPRHETGTNNPLKVKAWGEKQEEGRTWVGQPLIWKVWGLEPPLGHEVHAARARAGVQEVEASGGAKAATSQVTFQTCPTRDPSGLREEIGPFWQGPGVENLSPMKQLPREPHGGQDQDLGDVRSPPGPRGPQLPSVGWRIRSRRWARRAP